ncbi:hypothetical protein BC629DRAFT_1596083 [Irpex lacteus]|nr:hypothetical protein BC629DRAFT_1596083 [Irpex lacteus]
MAPTRSSFRIKGPVAIKKGLRASPDDQQNAAGEREDAQIKHYKTMHLGLTPDQPLPYHIKASLEVYKQAMRAALPEASDCVGYAVPSTLPLPPRLRPLPPLRIRPRVYRVFCIINSPKYSRGIYL